MINRNNIYEGVRIIQNNPEQPTSMSLKGTVQSIEFTGEGEYDYVAAVLPDEECRQLPGIKDNCHFGLTFCLGFDIDLLPNDIFVQDAPHIMQKFAVNIRLLGNDSRDFYYELVPMLMAYGYEIDTQKDVYSAPEARKGKKRIYCHSRQFAGECPPSEFEQIEQMLRHGKTYEICNIRLSDLMFDYTEAEELEQYHLKYDDTIRTRILEVFRTESPSDYRNTHRMIEILSKEIKIITINNYCWSGDGSTSTEYIKAAYHSLLKEGKISINPDDILLSRTKEMI